MFELNRRLKDDTEEIADLKLCKVLLMNDSSFPWLILVPRVENIFELYELSKDDRLLLMEEITSASKILEALWGPDKINVGMLGNIVRQLHVHVIARFKHDRAWPGPVWGSGEAMPYSSGELKETASRLKEAFERSWVKGS